jgi:hypothetical protein
MVSSKASLALAGLILSALWAPGAQAKVTEIFTISDFQPASGGVNFTVIQSVTGSFTEGTTAADDTSNVTVVEAGQGQTATYTLTGPENGPEWTVTSQYFSPSTASFRINPFGPGPVSTGVGVSLTDVVFDDSGAVTITETSVMSTPEPSTWALMLIGFAGLGLAGWTGARRRTASPVKA